MISQSIRRRRLPKQLRSRRHLGRRGLVIVGLIGYLFSLAGPAQAADFAPLSGDGSSWAGPAIDQWGKDVRPQGIVVNFNADGSAAGRQNYSTNQADFAATDIAYLSQADPFGGGLESVNVAYSYVPIVAGGTAFMYNLTVGGRQITDLKLSGDTVSKIFTGQITNWNDPQIAHDYGSALPSQPITVVTRADGSGATYQVTRWMSKQYSSQWNAFCAAHNGPSPCPPTEFYPGFAGSQQRNGSDQVANYVASPSYGQGSIGYDEYAYALNSNIPVVKLLNPAGYYTLPTASNVAIALQAAVIDEDPNSLTFLIQNLDNVYTNSDPRSYPLSSYSYLIVPRTSRVINNNATGPPGNFNDDKGITLSTWLSYVLCGAQQEAGTLGYSPLPKNLVVGGFAQVDNIPGHVATPDTAQLNGCNNPTYHDGVNYLVRDAPQPSPCDALLVPSTCAGPAVAPGQSVAPAATSAAAGGGAAASGGTTAGKSTAGRTATAKTTIGPRPGVKVTGAPGHGATGPALASSAVGIPNSAATRANPGAAASGASGLIGGGSQNRLGSKASTAQARPSLDPETGVVIAAGNADNGGAAKGNGASPAPIYAQTVAVQGSAGGRSLFGALTALELVLAISIPPLLGGWLRHRRRSS